MAARKFWLFKSEPDVFSIDDLAGEPRKTTTWEGVRNYQVRNMLRDDIQVGDGVLFYHSRVQPMAIAGTATVVKAGYPDHFALDSSHRYYDPKSNADQPTWYMVDIKLVQKFPEPVTRDQLAADKVAAGMMVMKRGSRLSIQPVTKQQWERVHKLAGVKAR